MLARNEPSALRGADSRFLGGETQCKTCPDCPRQTSRCQHFLSKSIPLRKYTNKHIRPPSISSLYLDDKCAPPLNHDLPFNYPLSSQKRYTGIMCSHPKPHHILRLPDSDTYAQTSGAKYGYFPWLLTPFALQEPYPTGREFDFLFRMDPPPFPHPPQQLGFTSKYDMNPRIIVFPSLAFSCAFMPRGVSWLKKGPAPDLIGSKVPTGECFHGKVNSIRDDGVKEWDRITYFPPVQLERLIFPIQVWLFGCFAL